MAGHAPEFRLFHMTQQGHDRKDRVPMQLKYPPEVYQTFLLKQYLESNYLTFTEIDYFKKTITSPNKNKKDVQQLIKEFESSIHFGKVRFAERECFTKQDVPGLSQLIFNSDGTPKSEIQSYLVKSTKQFKKQGKYYLELYKEKSEPCCKIYANSEEKCGRIAKQIENAFNKHHLEKDKLTDKLSSFFEHWRQKGKLVTRPQSNKSSILYIYCTNDLVIELVELISEPHSEVVSVADHYFAFFKQYGQDLLHSEARNCNVTANLSPDDRNLMIEGSQSDREKYKERLKASVHKECFTLTRPFNQDESTQFDNVAAGHACSWSCNVFDQSEGRHIEGCEYLTTFYHPGCPGSLSCITGDVTQLNVDGMVIMVTDKLFPLHDKKGFHEIGPDYFTGKSYCLGDVVYRKTMNKQYKCSLGLVTEYANATVNSALHANVTRDILKTLEQYKCRTVCIPVTVMSGNHAIDEYVKILVDTYIKDKWEEVEVHLHLCFDRSFKDIKTICKLVDDTFKRASGRFLRRRIGQNNDDTIQGISIKTESKGLQLIMVDAIMNPSKHNLDLNQGYVSRSLSEAAGPELQRKCNTDCPHGLDNNKVLVTPPYKLCDKNHGLKVIIHGVLPLFNITNYQKDIKKLMKLCLMKAEEQGYRSITFPALGTGNHGNPKRETIKVMLDAVEEFEKESLANKLKTVVFALPDDESNTIFQRETFWRSTPVNPYVQENEGSTFIEGTFKSNKNTVAIIFGQTFEELPSYTVDVHFDVGLHESHRFSYATEAGGNSQYDSLTVRLGVASNDTESVKVAMKSCLDYCKLHRITEIKLNRIKNIHLGKGQYYQAVVEEIEKFVKSCRTSGIVGYSYECCYVSKIYVTVTDNEMAKLHSQFMETPGSTFSGLTSMWGGRILNWQTYKSGPTRKPVQIQVVGTSKEAVCQVKNDMMDIVDRGTPNSSDRGQVERDPNSNIYNGARPKEKYQLPGSSSSNSSSSSKNNNNNNNTVERYDHGHNRQNADYEDESGSRKGNIKDIKISAEINIGFIKFKRKFNDLERWMRKVKEEFKLTIDQHNSHSESYRVYGKYALIMAFKQYLDNDFPRDPCAQKGSDYLGNRSEYDLAIDDETSESDGEDETAITDTLIVMDASKAFGLTKLYLPNDLGAVSWTSSSDKGGLHVQCKTSNVERLQKFILEKANLMKFEEIDCEDLDELLVAESEMITAQNESIDTNFHYELSHDEFNIAVIGREATIIENLKDRLRSLISGRERNGAVSTLSITSPPNQETKNSSIKVCIYSGDILNLEVEVIVIPANQSTSKIKGLQEVVLNTAGQEVIDEYKRKGVTMSPGQLWKTMAGDLPYRHLFHAYLPHWGSKQIATDRERIDLLENALVTCFKAADEEGCTSIGLPFIGSGNCGYDLEICAQQYYRAITSTEWNPMKLHEIHFVSNKQGQVSLVRGILEDQLGKCRVKRKFTIEGRASLPDIKTPPDYLKIGWNEETRLFITEGDLTTMQADVIACHQSRTFTIQTGLPMKIYDMCGMTGKSDHLVKRNMVHQEDWVYSISPGDGSLHCRKILYIIIPYFQHSKMTEFEGKLSKATGLVLDRCVSEKYDSVALPFFGKMENDSKEATRSRCRAIVNGIFNHVYQSNKAIREIHFVDDNKEIVGLLREDVLRRLRQIKHGSVV